MKNGRKVFSTIGIILGAIGIVLTAAITINVLSFVASSSLTFIIWKVKTNNQRKLIVYACFIIYILVIAIFSDKNWSILLYK